jgi:hypothetical protein
MRLVYEGNGHIDILTCSKKSLNLSSSNIPNGSQAEGPENSKRCLTPLQKTAATLKNHET